jgi:hypothetical protein
MLGAAFRGNHPQQVAARWYESERFCFIRCEGGPGKKKKNNNNNNNNNIKKNHKSNPCAQTHPKKKKKKNNKKSQPPHPDPPKSVAPGLDPRLNRRIRWHSRRLDRRWDSVLGGLGTRFLI